MRLQLSSNQLLVILLLGAGLLTAFSTSAAQMAPLPPEHSVGSVSYMSGGIGQDEANAMKQAASRYPLELMFLAREKDGHDAYKAGDTVTIRDHAGKIVLNTESEGPILLAKLPPGTYQVKAVDHGQIRERSVNLKTDQHAHLAFEW